MTMTTNPNQMLDGNSRRLELAPEDATPPANIPTDATLPSGGALRNGRLSLDALPANLTIAIDGPARTGKNTAGELVAEAIGGVLVDSGRFYRALTQAAVVAGINLDVPAAIAQFCRQVRLEAHLDYDGGQVREAVVSVNGVCFGKQELNAIGADAPKLGKLAPVRDMVNLALRRLCGTGRVIVLGRDMGARVFPDADMKIFFTAPTDVLEQRQLQTTGLPGVTQRLAADQNNTFCAAEALKIDTAQHPPAAVCDLILVEISRRFMGGGTSRSTVAE
jgi:cytidylate kinase